MATTGFWPVQGRLKEVIDYAENPDKTIDRKFLDDDLYKALRYTENDDKTDQKMFVTAINCPTKQAYAYMTATKRRYGKLGGNVAYHGFQSFRTGEVTPEERQEKNQAARELSKKLKPLRNNLKLAQTALEHYPGVWELLQAERETETKA